MGFTLKLSKCRSLSIFSGAPTEIEFSIGNSTIQSLKDHPHKFLGSQICFSGKSSETYDFIRKEISLKLQNIDNCSVRPEYKLCIYSRYLLPSIRFLLTVHTLQKSHLDALDAFTDKYVKSWLHRYPKQRCQYRYCTYPSRPQHTEALRYLLEGTVSGIHTVETSRR